MEKSNQGATSQEVKHLHFDERNIEGSHEGSAAAPSNHINEAHEGSAAAPSNQINEADGAQPLCFVCHKEPAAYQPDSCQCAFSYCKKCAMKCATGGKCKKCQTFFGSLKMSIMS